MSRAAPIALSFVVVTLLLAACAPGGGGGKKVPGDDDGGRVDLLPFAHDRLAVGDRWYIYDGGSHVLSPRDERYVVREGQGSEARFAAFRLVSYYDPDIAESGRFTVEYARFEGGSFGEPTERLTSRNVKGHEPLCLDFFGASLEVGCDQGNWQVQLGTAPFLIVAGPLVVLNPTLRFRDDSAPVRVATLPGVGLSDLPAPTSLVELDDKAPEGWETPEWDRSRLARDLPRAGRLLGARFVDEGHHGRDDVYFMVGSARVLVRLAIAPEVDGEVSSGVVVRYAVAPLDFGEKTFGAFSEVREQLLEPDEEQTLYLRFLLEEEELLVEETPLGAPAPFALTWDLALSRYEGVPSFALSSAAALFNHTAAGGEDASAFDDALPPSPSE